jgi:ABC-type phosphate/phosphonate transport system permease subunit
MAKSCFTKLNKVGRSLSILNIRRAGSIGARLAFYRRFYNLDKIRKLSYLTVNRVYRQ